MSSILINYIKKRKNGSELRSSYANLSGITGIICNLLLCAVKFAVGALTGSVSVTADAVNNLSDSASNIVTLTGTRLSDKPDDKEHPFGHGRIEYVSALIVAVSIFVVSIELAKSSITKIIYPAGTKFSPVYVIILIGTVLVKLWMAYFNNRLYKLTDNVNLKAVRQDSINDCVATASTVASLVLSYAFHIKRLDGIIGIGVSLFIFCSGIDIIKQQEHNNCIGNHRANHEWTSSAVSATQSIRHMSNNRVGDRIPNNCDQGNGTSDRRVNTNDVRQEKQEIKVKYVITDGVADLTNTIAKFCLDT